MSQGERRLCADDGILYTKEEFIDYFGEGIGMQRWITAPMEKPKALALRDSTGGSGNSMGSGKAGVPKFAPNPNLRLSTENLGGLGTVGLTTARVPVKLEKARFGVAVNPVAPRETHLKNALLTPKTQGRLRKYWILLALTILALIGLIVALIMFLLPCDPILTPFETVSIVNTTNFTNTSYNVTNFLNRTVNSTSFNAAPFDGMILIDESGSITNPRFCGQNCKFVDEVNLSILVAGTLYNSIASKGRASGIDVHFTLGGLTWNSDVSNTKNFPPTPDIGVAIREITKFKENVDSGGTMFAPPLAECAGYVKKGTAVSGDQGAFKMCMLLSDGVNFDKDLNQNGPTGTCEEQECRTLCQEYGLGNGQIGNNPNCEVENIAWVIKTRMNITIPAAYLAIGEQDRDLNANNMYCYSSCNTIYKSIDECKQRIFPSTNAITNAAIREKCRFFIDGEFNAANNNADLRTKLLELANAVASEVTVQSQESSAVTVETEQSLAEIVTSEQSSVETVQTGVKEEGCKDPNYFWLLLFFLPLLLYLLYFPLKRRRDLWKEQIRERLIAQREAMHEDRVARMAKAQAIRERVERLQAEQAAKQQKIDEAEKAAAEKALGVEKAAEVANAAAMERAQKEAAQKEAAAKKLEADEKVAEKEKEIEELKPMAEPKPKPKPKPKPPEPGEKKKFKWNITAADQYIWAGGGGGAAPQNVAWGRLGKPTEQSKAANGGMLSPSYMFGRKSAMRKSTAGRKSKAGSAAGDDGEDPMQEEEETHDHHDYRKRLSMAVKQEANERKEQQAAMDELDSLEDEIKAAVAAAAMTSEAAEKADLELQQALKELEALKKEEAEEDEKYNKDFLQDLQYEQAGKLEEDGEFWLRCCACCCRIEVEDDDTFLASIDRGRGRDRIESQHFINKV